MATGQAKALHERNGQKVVVVNRRGIPQRSVVFENNPRLATVHDRHAQRLLNCGGARPYIAGKSDTHWIWCRWTIAPGELYFSDEERAFAEPYAGRILIEPTTKVPGGNKSWLPERWQQVVHRTGHALVQVGQEGTPWLDGVVGVVTSFRQAAAVLSVSRAFVGAEGALHHSAAALNVPAVVLWSHFISPEFTGYTSQRNIRHAAGWCGSRIPCEACKESMRAISVDEVIQNLEDIL